MIYQVTATRQGTMFATVTVDRPDALSAIARVEEMLKAKPLKALMGETLVKWTGFDFVARKMA